MAEALAGGTGVVGWGLRNAARLSRGRVVTDATVTSPDLTWGFMWFLLEEGERKMIATTFKTLAGRQAGRHARTHVTSVSCGDVLEALSSFKGQN